MKSGWNPPDFTGEIHQISGWNPLDFKGEIPHPAFIKLKSFCWNTCFYNFGWISQVKSGWNPPDFTGKIHQISGWNPLDFKGAIPHPAFIKLKSFCWNTCFYNFGWISPEICRISWNPPDFMDFMKSTRFHLKSARFHLKSTGFHGFHEICRISWNPPDFMVKSARFHGWNLPDFMKSVWNPPDFMKSVWNPPDFMKSVWNPPDFKLWAFVW